MTCNHALTMHMIIKPYMYQGIQSVVLVVLEMETYAVYF